MGKRVNKRELAEILGKSERTLTEWQTAEGLPLVYDGVRGEENVYDTEEVIAWYARRELARAREQSPRDRLDAIRAQREELGLRRDIEQLVDVGVLEPLLDRFVDDVSNTIDGLPEKYALLFQQVQDPAGQHQLLLQLAKEVRDALGSFDFAAFAAGDPGGRAAELVGASAKDSPALPAPA